jgi:hypothetical protein
MTLLLKKRDATGDATKFLDRLREQLRRPKIECPTCAWKPTSTSTWTCVTTGAPEHFTAGCGAVWNTFETAGRCPSCSYQWQYTACLHCHTWAPHEDWYSFEED